MKKIANIGFMVSLIAATITIPFNIVNLYGNKMFMLNFIIIGIAAFLWLLAIRSIAYYKRPVFYREEPKEVNGIDVELVEKEFAKEKHHVNKKM